MQQYLELCEHILLNGEHRQDRTGTGTLSVFGHQTRYDLSGGKIPLLTTKKVNFKAVVAELLWFLSGSTNVKDLDSKIWDSWVLDDHGNLGPIYSWQWRSWGKVESLPYEGIDQITNVIESIKNNPYSRRHIVSAWNVADLPLMALPPCHLLFQFYVHTNGALDCQLYQRSADVAIGVPFNIASYGLLTHMIANECGLHAGTLVHTIGDAHIYVNHIDGVTEQLKRPPKPEKPTVVLTAGKPVLEMTKEDIALENYNPHPAIKFEIAV